MVSTHPSEKYSSDWIISPGRDEHKKYLSCHHPAIFPKPELVGSLDSHFLIYQQLCSEAPSHRLRFANGNGAWSKNHPKKINTLPKGGLFHSFFFIPMGSKSVKKTPNYDKQNLTITTLEVPNEGRIHSPPSESQKMGVLRSRCQIGTTFLNKNNGGTNSNRPLFSCLTIQNTYLRSHCSNSLHPKKRGGGPTTW